MLSTSTHHSRDTRRWVRPITLTLLGACLVLAGIGGCGTPSLSKHNTVREVRIGEEVTPRLLQVQRGDEVRWQNQLERPVQVGILNTKWQDDIVCQKGFRRFGQIDDLVTIPPHSYVSLCFSKPGTIRYNVWLDPKNLTGSMSPTSTIHVD